MNRFVTTILILTLLAGITFAAAPSVSVTGPSDNYWNDGSHDITFTVLDDDNPADVNTILYYSTSAGSKTTQITTPDLNLSDTGCDGTDFSSTKTCTYSWTISSISDGNYFVDVEVFDLNTPDSVVASSSSFMIDNTLPTITITMPQDGNTSYDSQLVEFDVNKNGSPIDLSTISVTLVGNSTDFTSGSCTNFDGHYHCSYTESNINSNATAYTIRVNASDLAGNAAAQVDSDFTFSDSTAPSKVTGVGTSAGDAQITVSWSANSESDLNVYWVYQSESSGFTADSSTLIGTTSSTSYTSTSLTNGTTYYFKVKADDTSGNLSDVSDEVSKAPVAASSSSAPTGTPSISSDTHDEDEWTSNDEPEFDWTSVSNTNDYRYALNDTSDYIIDNDDDSTGTTREKNYTGRDDNIYWFHVAGCNSSGCGPTDHYKIKIDKTGPDVPTNIFGISQSDGSIFLSWDDADDRPSGDNSGIKEYTVYRSEDNDFEIIDAGVEEFTGIERTNFTDDERDLVRGIAYYYRIQAIDNAGNEGVRSVDKRVLLAGGSCSLGISSDVPENLKAGELNIDISVSNGDLFDADIKVKMPGKGYETLSTNQEGRSFEEMYLVPEGISGTGSILIQGEDQEGNVCEKLIEFTVDSIKPTITINSPANGEKVSGQVLINVSASDSESEIEKVEAFVEGIRVGTLEKKGDSYEFSWNSNSKLNKTYKLEVSAQDNAGNKAVAEIEIEVDNLNEEIFIEKQGTFDITNLMTIFRNAGVKEELLSEAQTLFMENSPKRKLLITRADDGLKVTIIINFKNSGRIKAFQLLEIIPKDVANNANNIVSDQQFTVIQQDPIIKFDLGEVTSGKAITVEYIAATGLTEQQANNVASAFDSYKAPPVLLEQSRQNPIEITPLSDMLWIIFIIAAILVILLGAIGILGGGAFLFHRIKKNGNGLKSDGLHTVYNKKTGGLGDLFKKEPDEKKGKFAWNDD